MWSALRAGALSSSHLPVAHRWKNLPSSHPIFSRYFSSSAASSVEKNNELLSLSEVEKILHDVRADDVKVISSPKGCEFADYIVIATGRSPWHVRNISQALIYKKSVNDVWSKGLSFQSNKLPDSNLGFDMFLSSNEQVKQKQQGAKRMVLPSVVGQEGGKWIVIDSGVVFFSFSVPLL